ncbi:hypothetical protein ACFORG_02770 [Lutimaribacter marinistellae]|uniref:Flagellar FliJ protein n=1 Tax=Lutimaribacter marinistellae TaxID=1820329 RepID=A0ABV7TBY7_9RHOB
MRKPPFEDMSRICEAAYLAEHERIRTVLEAEARARANLAKLDRQAAETRAAQDLAEGYRALGADLVWDGWEARTRAALTTELARARAQRLVAMDGLRAAFGRREAVAALQREDAIKRKTARDKARAERLLQDLAIAPADDRR